MVLLSSLVLRWSLVLIAERVGAAVAFGIGAELVAGSALNVGTRGFVLPTGGSNGLTVSGLLVAKLNIGPGILTATPG